MFQRKKSKLLNINIPLALLLYIIVFLHMPENLSIHPEWLCCQTINSYINADVWHTEKLHHMSFSQHEKS